jgi:hypothetical protein
MIFSFDLFLLPRIADILSRHGSDAWFKVAPFDHLQRIRLQALFVSVCSRLM